MIDAEQIAATVGWLLDGARPARRPGEILGALCRRLVDGGIPLWRVGVFVQTLHPHIFGSRLLWEEGKEVFIQDAPLEIITSETYRTSPIAAVMGSGETLRRRVCDRHCPMDFPILKELIWTGGTDYLVTPLRFVDGAIHAVSWATRQPGGFTDEELGVIGLITPPLTRLAEIWSLHRVAANLLDAYVGHQTGARVLAGQIRRGDTEVIRAAIWLSDLREFTALTERLPPAEVIELLNLYFDCQVPAIQSRGGEVLKFMGDGLLAIFPADDNRAPADACAAAIAAARDAGGELAKLKAEGAQTHAADMRFSIALHYGDVLYGNIGSGNRLDFTCIGPAVNLASRLERLARDLGRSLIASTDFASTCGEPADLHPLGSFALRGIEQPHVVYGAGTDA